MRSVVRLLVTFLVAAGLVAGLGSVASASPAARPGEAGAVLSGMRVQAGGSWDSFPAIYRNRYWPQAGVWMEYNTLFNAAQTRAINASGLVPPFADSHLPFAGVGAWLRSDTGLDLLVRRGGCFAMGVRKDPVWSPMAKKWVSAIVQPYSSPPYLKSSTDLVCENRPSQR
ncbi:hypothetical protein GTV32_15400 [Gordonia sp. SID5947]|uniref:hypothetical protein n=1 Tax=Gordonia sp. SID5947 TaxID=2690315 RepID=UPI0013689192|nr:hypothetical protein [Gordonia sp. SID5947]MYR07606.1 hypothetical protein [Gordonia sp. SID5947]